MSVQIIISGADAAESLQELSSLAAGFTGAKQVDKPITKTKKAEKPAETSPVEEEDVMPGASGKQEGEKAPSVVELRAKANEVTDKKKVKALLEDLGYKSLSDIPDEERAAFMEALGEL